MQTLLCLLLAATPNAANPAQSAMGLRDAVQYALQHSPKIASAKTSEGIRGLERDNAQAKLYPSLDLSANQGLQKSIPEPVPPAPPPTSTFGQLDLKLTETIYDNGQSLTQRDIAERNQQVARLNFLKTRDDVALEVAKAYYALSQAEMVLGLKRQQQELLNKQFRQTRDQYRQGLKTKKDYQRFQSEVQKASIDLLAAESARRTAEIEMRRAMGADIDGGAVQFATVQAGDARRAALVFPSDLPKLEDSYTARIAKFEDAAAVSNIDLARRKYWPQVTLSTDVDYNNPDYIGAQAPNYTQDTVAWHLILGLTYNIWDSGSRRRDIGIAEAQRTVHDQDTKAQLQTLDAQMRTLMESIDSLKESFQLNKKLMALEEENFTGLEQDYREGRVAYLDLVTGLTDLLNARVSYYSTYISALQALAQYNYYKGTIYEALAGS